MYFMIRIISQLYCLYKQCHHLIFIINVLLFSFTFVAWKCTLENVTKFLLVIITKMAKINFGLCQKISVND